MGGRGRRRTAVVAAVGVLVIGGGLSLAGCGEAGPGAIVGRSDPRQREFPAIDEGGLTAGQKAFLTVVRAEYAAQRKGSTYSEGLDEPWCADFVSWVAKERGAPLKNPHSGSWRVPGVFTLVEVLQAEGTYRAPGSGYVPKLGDIIVYGDSSPYGQHTNYVLVSGQGRVTTLGGNEYGGVAIVEHALDGKLGVIAYGTR